MMDQRPYERTAHPWQTALTYIACYVIWLAYGALSLWTILVYRDAVLGLFPIIGPWVMGAIDKFGILLFGLLALIWILYMEHYLRTGVENGKFWPRVLRVTIGQVVVLAIAQGLKLATFLWI